MMKDSGQGDPKKVTENIEKLLCFIELVVWGQTKSIVTLLGPKKVNEGHNTLIHVYRQQAQ